MSWNPNVTKHLANPNHCQPLSEPKEIIQFVLDIRCPVGSSRGPDPITEERTAPGDHGTRVA